MKYRNERCFMGGVLRPPEYSWAVSDASSIRRIVDALG
jgi:hypothetical protein